MIDKINALANKGMKIWLWVILVVIAYAIISGMFDDTPRSVRDAKTELFLSYRDNIYPTAQCDSKEIDDSWVILCHPADKAMGGLFEIVGSDDDYLIYALNGTAQTHSEKMGHKIAINKNSSVSAYDAMQKFKEDIEG